MDAVYIWLDAAGRFRSKMRNIPEDSGGKDLIWNYDGSSTGQASTENSEVILVPVKIYRTLHEKLAYFLCQTYASNGNIVPPNTWEALKPYQDDIKAMGLKFGFEQEFFVYEAATLQPIDYARTKESPQDIFYCSVGTPSPALNNRKLEELVSKVYFYALKYNIPCTGYNLEVAPGQAEIQVCSWAIDACHDLIFLRYLLWDILGKEGYYPVFDPKPCGPERNGSGLHTNVSTFKTMEEGGYEEIKKILHKLEKNHAEHIQVYGEGNQLRLTGKHETSSMTVFSWGVGSRAASVRIPNTTAKEGKGYFEDRRPAANADPYKICLRMFQTLCA